MNAFYCSVLVVLLTISSLGCVGGNTDSTDDPVVAEPSSQVPPEHDSGAAIYKANCGMCHDHGEAAAPRLGNAKQWTKRVGQGAETLTTHAFDGFEGMWGEMPPQGDDLSREEILSAVEWMLYCVDHSIQAH